MTIKIRSILLRDDGILVDIIYQQVSGFIFESLIISYNLEVSAVQSIKDYLGEDIIIDCEVVDIRTVQIEIEQ